MSGLTQPLSESQLSSLSSLFRTPERQVPHGRYLPLARRATDRVRALDAPERKPRIRARQRRSSQWPPWSCFEFRMAVG